MRNQDGFKAKINWLIILMTLIRVLAACFIELGNDEVYYYTYAEQLDWNHFDHPPIIGVVIRFFTLNLHWVSELSMRLGAIIGAVAGTWLIAQIGLRIKNERTGLIAALLYNASIYTGIISGLFILPDSPAVVFWLAAIYTILEAIRSDHSQETSTRLIWTGLWIGLATMSKVHGCFLWFGILAYALFCHRRLFRFGGLYIGILLSLVIFSPILYWNIQHDFVTWKFHGERIDVSGFHLDFLSFVRSVLGQFIYNNPLVVMLVVSALLAWIKRIYFLERTSRTLLLWLGLPIILFTTIISLFKPILPHWSGPGFIPLMLLTAAWMDERLTLGHRTTTGRRIINSLLYLNIAVMILGVLLVRFFPGTMGKQTQQELGKGDFTLEMNCV